MIRNLGSRISRKWCQTEFVSTKDHYNVAYRLPIKVVNVTFGDPGRSRSLTEILDAEYLANGARQRVRIPRFAL